MAADLLGSADRLLGSEHAHEADILNPFAGGLDRSAEHGQPIAREAGRRRDRRDRFGR
ncbi:MAG TPA: hypothetical protein VFG59_19385 [Anaeromyxobacter sp.]|nr:hypothetical protein [Anaeromyxobacter sp.]